MLCRCHHTLVGKASYNCMELLCVDDAYQSEVCALTLHALHGEPKRLSALRLAINDKIQSLSLENYRVHIDNHNCGNTVR